MSAVVAFLHHLAAFALVAAVVVEFVLTRGEITATDARRIVAADAVLARCHRWDLAGGRPPARLLLREGRCLLLEQRSVPRQARNLRDPCDPVDLSDSRIPILARCPSCRPSSGARPQPCRTHSLAAALGDHRDRSDPSVRRTYGARNRNALVNRSCEPEGRASTGRRPHRPSVLPVSPAAAGKLPRSFLRPAAGSELVNE